MTPRWQQVVHRALLLLVCLLCVPMSLAVTLTESPRQSLLPGVQYLVESADEALDVADFDRELLRNRLLPVSVDRLRTSTQGQPLWLTLEISNPSSRHLSQAMLLFSTPNPVSVALWEDGSARSDAVFSSIRGPALAVDLPPGTTREWIIRIEGPSAINLGLNLESPAEFNRRNQWLNAYLFTFIGALFLGAVGLTLRQYRWIRRYDRPAGARWIFWPGYLLFLMGFALWHYVGAALFVSTTENLAEPAAALLAAAAYFLAIIWWARTGHYDRRLLALIMLGLLVAVAIGYRVSPQWILVLMVIMGLARLASFGLRMRTNLPIHVVVAPLTLLVWGLLELVQHSPLAFSSEIQPALLITVMSIHAAFVHQGFFPPRRDTELLAAPKRSGMHNEEVLVLLRKLNHDLRSPIHGVLGMTSLLSETNLNINQQEYVATTHNAGIQMLNLADEMRALTRIFNDQVKVRPRSIDLHEFMHEVVSPFARLASQKSIEVITEVLSDVPHQVKVDADMLSQVMRIILDNSVKFTEEGVIQVAVRLENGNRLRIRIDDSGQGVAEQDIARLFEFQSGGFEDESGQRGMRLGLPIASELIKAMGGRIGVSRSGEKGSSFWLILPFEPDDTPPEATDPETLAPLLQQKILIVDDHLAVRKVLEDQTHNWGMKPELASSGKEALALLQSHMFFHHPFDWVIIDYRMPEMNGLELLEKIRRIEGLSHLRCIVMTGIDLHYVEQAADDLAVVAVMAKPVNNRELLRLLREHA